MKTSLVAILVAASGSSVAAFSFSKLNNKRCTITSTSIAMSSSFGYRNNNRSGGYRNRNDDLDYDDDSYDDEYRSNGIYNGDYEGDDYLRFSGRNNNNNDWRPNNNLWRPTNNSWGGLPLGFGGNRNINNSNNGGRRNKWNRNNNNSFGGRRSGGLRSYQPEFRDYGYDTYDYDPYVNDSPYSRRSESFRDTSNNDRYRRRDNFGGRYNQRGYAEQRTFGGRVRSNTYGNYGSEGFRRGNALDRIQDYVTPRNREMIQQRQNGMARYGNQQQYDVNRGNVRAGSSSDFRRGRGFDRIQDFLSPREREMRQMQDNRILGRGVYQQGYYDDGRGGGYGGYQGEGMGDTYGRDMYDDFSYSSSGGRRRDSYDGTSGYDSIYNEGLADRSYSGRRNSGSGWDNLKNVFRTTGGA